MWYWYWVVEGMVGVEWLLVCVNVGLWCFGDVLMLVDVCLVL